MSQNQTLSSSTLPSTWTNSHQTSKSPTNMPQKTSKPKTTDPALQKCDAIASRTDSMFNDSAEDFRTPKALRKRGNLAWKLNKNPKTLKAAKTTKRRRPLKNSTLDIIESNFEENPEHLQMAIALSKSSYEAEQGSESLAKEEVPDVLKILRNSKPTSLERFGFKAAKSVQNKQPYAPSLEASGRVRNRFKYITPILLIRSEEDREALITSKISLIISQPNFPSKPTADSSLLSSRLQAFQDLDLSLFKLDQIYESNRFYTESLKLPKEGSKCGHLLKNWACIPGRDKSPARHPKVQKENRETPNKESGISSLRSSSRSVSPDLFSSEDELCGTASEKAEEEEESSTASKRVSFYSLDEFEVVTPNEKGRDSAERSAAGDDDVFECLSSAPCSPAANTSEIGDDFFDSAVDRGEISVFMPIKEPLSCETHAVQQVDSFNSSDNHTAEVSPKLDHVASPVSRYSYNSANLNVTDYVHNLLNQENYSFALDEANENSDSSNVLIVDESPVQHEKNQSKSSTPDKCIIKTKNITPMPDYDTMATPQLNKHLEKVGVKPLKRTRGAKLLKYIYESTHPYVDSTVNKRTSSRGEVISKSDMEDGTVLKRRKSGHGNDVGNIKEVSSSRFDGSAPEIAGDCIIKNEKQEDLIFERRQSTKVPSCQVPLQIVWHNFLSCNPALRQNILLYEPVQLESLHVMLKDQGFKFHIQDLLSFLDKKCITIRTAQKQMQR